MAYLYGEMYREFEELISKGYKFEQAGRDIAADKTGLITMEVDGVWLSSLVDYHISLARFIRKIIPLAGLSPHIYYDIMSLATNINDISISFRLIDFHGKPRSIHFLNPREVGERKVWYGKDMVERLVEYDQIQRKYSGRKGIWLWGNIEPEKYTWSAFINDLTACFHQFLIYIETAVGAYKPVSDKVYAHPKANPYAVELALKWEKALKILSSYSLTGGEDYVETTIFVREQVIEARVGSAPGHLTHIESKPLGYSVIYYDFENDVRYVIGQLAQDYGCQIIQDVKDERIELFCPSITNAFDNFMKYVLPFATSMDIRMRSPERYWSKIIPNYEEMMHGLEPKYIEYYACKWFIENVLRGKV